MTDDLLDELNELSAWIAAHAREIPRHRRTQATHILERVERMIPDPAEGDAA